ncbi:MAG: hypothetical protein NTX38_05600 [Methylobacter sp.]|nr:hypothetical protein [Methylobacter sp.]
MNVVHFDKCYQVHVERKKRIASNQVLQRDAMPNRLVTALGQAQLRILG